MAGSAVIGALRVNLGIDSADFDKGLKGATIKLGLIGGAAIAAGQAIGNALGRAIRGVAEAIPEMINQFDDLSKLSQKIGVPIDDLSRLKYAADLSGVSLDGLSTAFGILARNMLNAASGASKTAVDAFQQIGVSVKNADGSLRSSTDVFNDVVARFSNMEDGAQKTALAMEIFGKSGKDLIPLLNSGAQGLAALTAEADRYGVTIDASTGKAAEAFNDNLTRMGAIFNGLVTKITAAMLPTFENLSGIFVDLVSNTALMDTAATILTTTLKGLVSGGIIVGETFKTIGTIVASVGTAIGLTAKGDYQTAFEVLKTGLVDITASVQASADTIVKVWDDAVDNVTSVSVKKFTAPIIEGAHSAAAAVADAIQPAGQAISRIGDQAKQVGDVISQSFSSAFDAAIDGTFNLRDAIGGLLKDLAKLAINQAFNSLVGSIFGGGGLFGGGLGGAATGAPLNIVPPGFASGGSFQVGGAGGIDSKLIQFRATPGEMVSISKHDTAGGGNEIRMGDINIRMEGSSGDPATDKRQARAVSELVRGVVREEVAKMQAIGGQLNPVS